MDDLTKGYIAAAPHAGDGMDDLTKGYIAAPDSAAGKAGTSLWYLLYIWSLIE
ncbi:MAG: hypothetical protein ACLFWL_17475 [Candidatus Brocadiia bacterium]